MIKIRCIAVDDEPMALAKIGSYIQRMPYLDLVALCESPYEAMKIVMAQHIDAMFIDINMPDLNGLELAYSLSEPPMIVFTTAYAEYAAESYKIPAVDYLLKPFDFSDFQRAAKRLLKETKPTETASPVVDDEYLLIKDGYKYTNVHIADIMYIQGMRDYVKISIEGDDKSVIGSISMSKLMEKLPDYFQQVHRSWIVNIKKIKEIERLRIVIGKERIPISNNYRERFMDYMRPHSLDK